ncbi:MAG: hypothetical protein HY660_11840 [Armatimonadetes bacterium]|nr:hypothetical protein [Armatimonadota bacterium]
MDSAHQDTDAAGPRGIRFAHESEEELARILDFYGVRWEYEPRSFPLEWDDEERVTVSFTPDFYLPDLDLYIELTTLKQSLVTKKNRKVRRLRELYPGVRLKIFYGRDYRNLLRKYELQGAPRPTMDDEAETRGEAADETP